MALSQRTGDILRLLVADYIATGVPVGSLSLARQHRLAVSPATIRNDMVRLEEEGYIIRPHSSAGGVPADKGYRFYVELLPIGRAPEQAEKDALERTLEQVKRDIEQWARTAAATVSQLMGTLSFATTPRPESNRLKQVELLQIHDLSVLVVLILQGAHVLRHLVALDQPTTTSQLEQARNRLGKLFAGKTASEIANEDVEKLSSFERAVIESMLAMLHEEEVAATHDYVMEGLAALFEQPELARPGPARELAEALDDDETISTIASDASTNGAVSVVIGSENRRQTLREFSIVVSRYGIPGHANGIVGVLGPTRLAYHQAMPVVGHAATVLSDLVSEAYTGRRVLDTAGA
ncbi:MAG: heat-inducible transcription repressor HrcA [SAR202 cluster bacterium]|nr:heat-inducible transcription repressor HrcA [SAR202 cluster bacterium]